MAKARQVHCPKCKAMFTPNSRTGAQCQMCGTHVKVSREGRGGKNGIIIGLILGFLLRPVFFNRPVGWSWGWWLLNVSPLDLIAMAVLAYVCQKIAVAIYRRKDS